MLLDTIRCSTVGCRNEFTQDSSRWNLITTARDIGWTFSHDEEVVFCPEHGPETGVIEHWIVGCYTCDFEEEYDSEDEAKSEHCFHECEADTWIWSPEQARERAVAREAAREEYRANRTAREAEALAVAREGFRRQARIEDYANRWLRIRNVFLFWNRKYI